MPVDFCIAGFSCLCFASGAAAADLTLKMLSSSHDQSSLPVDIRWERLSGISGFFLTTFISSYQEIPSISSARERWARLGFLQRVDATP